MKWEVPYLRRWAFGREFSHIRVIQMIDTRRPKHNRSSFGHSNFSPRRQRIFNHYIVFESR